MALFHDCLQQHSQEQALGRRWVAFGVLGATGLHLGLLPLMGIDTDALVSRSEDDPIQIIVADADAELALSESPHEPWAAATPRSRDGSEASPPDSLDASESAAELEPPATLPEEELEPKKEPQEPAPEESMEPGALESPGPEVAAVPESEVTPEPETPADLANTAATIEGGGKPERIAKHPAAGTMSTARDTNPVVALALGLVSADSEGETPAESTELGGLLEGYFPEGTEDGGLDSPGVGNVARSSEPGDRGDSQGNGEGRGHGSRTVRCRSCDRPSYPASALADGIEGEPKINVQFDANGNVVSVTLVHTSGNPELDQAALASAQRWRFDAGGQSGSVSVEIPFVIEGSDRHREAQQQGERESATIPDPGPTADSGPEHSNQAAVRTEGNPDGSGGADRDTARNNRDDASADADSAVDRSELAATTPEGILEEATSGEGNGTSGRDNGIAAPAEFAEPEDTDAASETPTAPSRLVESTANPVVPSASATSADPPPAPAAPTTEPPASAAPATGE